MLCNEGGFQQQQTEEYRREYITYVRGTNATEKWRLNQKNVPLSPKKYIRNVDIRWSCVGVCFLVVPVVASTFVAPEFCVFVPGKINRWKF